MINVREVRRNLGANRRHRQHTGERDDANEQAVLDEVLPIVGPD
jgi:hypothetical protein